MALSTPKETAFPLPPDSLRKAWRVVTLAGLLGSIYYSLCVNGAPRTKFIADLGATPFDFGVISGLGAMAVGFQVFAGVIANRIRYRKVLWMVLVIAHRLCFIGILFAPFMAMGVHSRILWIIGVHFVHDSLANLGGPLWFSWMADIVPRESVNRHWANRQRFVTACSIFTEIAVAAFFDLFELRGHGQTGFLLIGATGVILGVIDILMFIVVPEPRNEQLRQVRLTEIILQPIRDRDFRRYLVFLAYWQFAVMLAAPFFAVYMIESLHMRTLTAQCIITMGSVGIVLTSRFWGLLGDNYGARAVMCMSIAGKTLIAIAFLVTPSAPSIFIPVMVVVFCLDGAMNSGLFIGMQGMVLRNTPRRNRAMYMAVSAFISAGLIGGAAPLISGKLITALIDRSGDWHFGIWRFNGYHVAFAISAVLRFGAIPLTNRLREPGGVPVSVVLQHLRMTNPIRIVRAVFRLEESQSIERRLHAAKLLGHLRSPLAIKSLIGALDDGERRVRHAAADALGRIGNSEASEALGRVLASPDSDTQSHAALALGRIGGDESLSVLLKNLNHMTPEALGPTIDALGRIGDSAAMLPLICLFESVEDRDLRRRIAKALSHLSASESIEEIIGVLQPTPSASG
jgi:MFS family permease